jgi:hypothetical protein
MGGQAEIEDDFCSLCLDRMVILLPEAELAGEEEMGGQ